MKELTGDVVNPLLVIGGGATGLEWLVPPPNPLLALLRQAYAQSLRPPFILALVAVCLGVPASCGVEWRNLKVVAAERERVKRVVEGEELENTGESRDDGGERKQVVVKREVEDREGET